MRLLADRLYSIEPTAAAALLGSKYVHGQQSKQQHPHAFRQAGQTGKATGKQTGSHKGMHAAGWLAWQAGRGYTCNHAIGEMGMQVSRVINRGLAIDLQLALAETACVAFIAVRHASTPSAHTWPLNSGWQQYPNLLEATTGAQTKPMFQHPAPLAPLQTSSNACRILRSRCMHQWQDRILQLPGGV